MSETSQSSSLGSPVLPLRKDGLTHEQALVQQGQILEEYYIDDNATRENPSPPPQMSPSRESKSQDEPGTIPAKRSSADSVERPNVPVKRIKLLNTRKPASKTAEEVTTGTRRSERNKKKRLAADAIDEQPNVPAKKSKKAKAKQPVPTDAIDEQQDVPAKKSKKAQGKQPVLNDTLNSQLASKTEKDSDESNTESADEADGNDPVATSTSKTITEIAVTSEQAPNTKHNKTLRQAKAVPIKTTDETDDEADDNQALTSNNIQQGRKGSKKEWSGTPTNMGTSAEKPPGAPNDIPWRCANRQCDTGFTYYNRDGVKSFGRKTISNFFGRNKKETNLIHADVWHIYCRKDYQRKKYACDKESGVALCEWSIENIKTQLDRIQLWRPNATFTVQLSSSMKKRSAAWQTYLRRNNNDEAKAQAEFDKDPQFKKKELKSKSTKKSATNVTLEETFPLDLAETFDQQQTGENFGFTRVHAVVQWVHDHVKAGLIDSMPPMEFLISEQAVGETIIDPKYNYERWIAQCDGTNFSTPGSSEAGDSKLDAEAGASKLDVETGASKLDAEPDDKTDAESASNDESADTVPGSLDPGSPDFLADAVKILDQFEAKWAASNDSDDNADDSTADDDDNTKDADNNENNGQ